MLASQSSHITLGLLKMCRMDVIQVQDNTYLDIYMNAFGCTNVCEFVRVCVNQRE